MSKIIHSMIRVKDLSHSLKFYAECFVLFRSLPGYRTAQRSVAGGELARLTLVEPRRQG